VIEPKQSKTFENLVPALLQSALGLIKKDADKYGDEVLSSFADIADAEPKFFKKDFKLVQQMMAAVVYDKDIDDSNLKETATEVLILILERIPSICKNDQAVLSSTVEMIFYNMVIYIIYRCKSTKKSKKSGPIPKKASRMNMRTERLTLTRSPSESRPSTV
jgi:hypothetical protein